MPRSYLLSLAFLSAFVVVAIIHIAIMTITSLHVLVFVLSKFYYSIQKLSEEVNHPSENLGKGTVEVSVVHEDNVTAEIQQVGLFHGCCLGLRQI